MPIKRYGLGREYAASVGAPGITEQPEGAFVRYEDYAAAIAHNELLVLKLKKADEEFAAIGAGGVSLMGGAKDAEIARLRWLIRDLIEHHAVPSTACKERASYENAIAALTHQEQV